MREIQVTRDLRPAFGAIRDQGQRPTCLAFAVSDTHAATIAANEPMSVEYLFFNAQMRAKKPRNSGATLPSILSALEHDGQPVETGWPYSPSENEPKGGWHPPPNIGDLFRHPAREGSGGMTDVKAALENGYPAVLLILLSQSFFSPPANGVLSYQPGEMPIPSLRHAIIAVGQGECTSGTYILIRNSWGTSWGSDGYAWLHEKSLETNLITFALLKDNSNAP